MIQELGALFIIGTALTFLISSMKCSRVDLWKSPQYGAVWAAQPAHVFTGTGNTYAMIVSTWVPTIALVYWTDQTVCEKPAA
jgi:hypothetical protein